MDYKRGHNYTGFLFSFEGGEGGGKSTQIKMLDERLRAQGYTTVITREPGGTPIGEEHRRLLKHHPGNMCPEAELFGMSASRAQLFTDVIIPALRDGQIVLTDRLHDSSTAYQGYGRGLSLDFVYAVNNVATKSISPDLTFLHDVPPSVGLQNRVKLKHTLEARDRFDEEESAFHQRVYEGYHKMAKLEPNRFVTVPFEYGKIEPTHELIYEHVISFIRRFGQNDSDSS